MSVGGILCLLAQEESWILSASYSLLRSPLGQSATLKVRQVRESKQAGWRSSGWTATVNGLAFSKAKVLMAHNPNQPRENRKHNPLTPDKNVQSEITRMSLCFPAGYQGHEYHCLRNWHVSLKHSVDYFANVGLHLSLSLSLSPGWVHIVWGEQSGFIRLVWLWHLIETLAGEKLGLIIWDCDFHVEIKDRCWSAAIFVWCAHINITCWTTRAGNCEVLWFKVWHCVLSWLQ